MPGNAREQAIHKIRTCQPGADRVDVVTGAGHYTRMDCVHAGAIFEADVALDATGYQLKVQRGNEVRFEHDAYRFGSTIGEVDLYLIGEGTHGNLESILGAHCMQVDAVSGVRFAVWAPAAKRVSVVGDFNEWDGRRHVMRLHPGTGVWELFLPDVVAGAHYKYEILSATGSLLPLKSDPFAIRMEPPTGNASVVYQSNYQWHDDAWMDHRSEANAPERAMCIYEVHLGSWRRQEGRWLSYHELADTLIPYVLDLGFTHIELLPVTEYPFDGSWGYQPVGLFAATWRFGEPDGLRAFVDRCHGAGLAVILDWVPAHFPKDDYGLSEFDGSYLYEHADPRRGEHRDWGTLIFNYGRSEVSNYLLASALYWVRSFHVDALRVDAVASMLYLDYSRDEGDWLPNAQGGNENNEAVAFMRKLTQQVAVEGATTMAEESTAWPQVTGPVQDGGLGFGFKWNMG
ncbi:MAG: 1,4-alpha-glucan branching enzyme, partial [Chromatiales bacterium]|nr:1,4-alpha-glucan branching enzyme [Chromatiales bacterium]